MKILPKEIEEKIIDYKCQLIHRKKYKKVMKQIEFIGNCEICLPCLRDGFMVVMIAARDSETNRRRAKYCIFWEQLVAL